MSGQTDFSFEITDNTFNLDSGGFSFETTPASQFNFTSGDFPFSQSAFDFGTEHEPKKAESPVREIENEEVFMSPASSPSAQVQVTFPEAQAPEPPQEVNLVEEPVDVPNKQEDEEVANDEPNSSHPLILQDLDAIETEITKVEMDCLVSNLASDAINIHKEQQMTTLENKVNEVQSRVKQLEESLQSKLNEGFDLIKQVEEKLTKVSSVVPLQDLTLKCEKFEQFVDSFESQAKRVNAEFKRMSDDLQIATAEFGKKCFEPLAKVKSLDESNANKEILIRNLEEEQAKSLETLMQKFMKLKEAKNIASSLMEKEEQLSKSRIEKAKEASEAKKSERQRLRSILEEKSREKTEMQSKLEQNQSMLAELREQAEKLKEDWQKMKDTESETKAKLLAAGARMEKIYQTYGTNLALKNKPIETESDIEARMIDLQFVLNNHTSRFAITRSEIEHFESRIEKTKIRIQESERRIEEDTQQLEELTAPSETDSTFELF